MIEFINAKSAIWRAVLACGVLVLFLSGGSPAWRAPKQRPPSVFSLPNSLDHPFAMNVSMNAAFLDQLARVGLMQLDRLDGKQFNIKSIATRIQLNDLRIEQRASLFSVSPEANALAFHVQCLRGRVTFYSQRRLNVVSVAYTTALPWEMAESVVYDSEKGSYEFNFSDCLEFSGTLLFQIGELTPQIYVGSLKINSYNKFNFDGFRVGLFFLERALTEVINRFALDGFVNKKLAGLWSSVEGAANSALVWNDASETQDRVPRVELAPLLPFFGQNRLYLSTRSLVKRLPHVQALPSSKRLPFGGPLDVFNVSGPLLNVALGQRFLDEALTLFLQIAPKLAGQEFPIYHSRTMKAIKVNQISIPRESIKLSLHKGHLLFHVTDAFIETEHSLNWEAHRFKNWFGRALAYFVSRFVEVDKRVPVVLKNLGFTATLALKHLPRNILPQQFATTPMGLRVCQIEQLGKVQKLAFNFKIAKVNAQSLIFPSVQELGDYDLRRTFVNSLVQAMLNRGLVFAKQNLEEKMHYFEHLYNCHLERSNVDLGGRVIFYRPLLDITANDVLNVEFPGFCIDTEKSYYAQDAVRIEHLGFPKEMDLCSKTEFSD